MYPNICESVFSSVREHKTHFSMSKKVDSWGSNAKLGYSVGQKVRFLSWLSENHPFLRQMWENSRFWRLQHPMSSKLKDRSLLCLHFDRLQISLMIVHFWCRDSEEMASFSPYRMSSQFWRYTFAYMKVLLFHQEGIKLNSERAKIWIAEVQVLKWCTMSDKKIRFLCLLAKITLFWAKSEKIHFFAVDNIQWAPN